MGTQTADERQLRAVSTLNRGDLHEYLKRTVELTPRAQEALLRRREAKVDAALAGKVDLTLQTQQDLARRDGRTATRLAGNRCLAPEVAEALLDRPGNEFELVAALAGNPATPEGILRGLWAHSGSRVVHEALLANPTLPLSVIGRVEDLPVRDQRQVAQRPDLTEEELGEFQLGNLPYWRLDGYGSEMRTHFLNHLAKVSWMTLGEALALSENCSDEALEIMLGLSENWAGTLEELREAAQELAHSETSAA